MIGATIITAVSLICLGVMGWKFAKAPLFIDRTPFEDGEFDETQDDPRLVEALREGMGQ